MLTRKTPLKGKRPKGSRGVKADADEGQVEAGHAPGRNVRAPLKASSGLKRSAQLKTSKPLKASSGLKRSGQLKTNSSLKASGGLKRNGPLKTLAPLKSSSSLKSKAALKPGRPLRGERQGDTDGASVARSGEMRRGTLKASVQPKSSATRQRKPLVNKTPLKSSSGFGTVAKSKPLTVKATLVRVELKYRKTVRKQKRRGPPVDPDYLAFVRTFPCFHCGMESHESSPTQPHHFEPSGTGTKCSDYDTVPLCNYCHNHLWHQHRTFPGGTSHEWREKFRANAAVLLADYRKSKNS